MAPPAPKSMTENCWQRPLLPPEPPMDWLWSNELSEIDVDPAEAIASQKAWPANAPVAPLPATAELWLKVLPVMVREPKLVLMAPPPAAPTNTPVAPSPPEA